MFKLFNAKGAAALAASLLTFGFAATGWCADASGEIEFADAAGVTHSSKGVSTPAAAMDAKGAVYLAWFEEEKDRNLLYIAASADGKNFSVPVRVNGGSDEPAGIHGSPMLATGSKGEIYVAWTTPREGAAFAAELKFSRSHDGGKTFSPAVNVSDAAQPASAGFESMAVGPDGSIYLAWLDGREKATAGSATYFAVSRDGGKSFSPNTKIDGNSCPCCRTALAIAPDGTLYAAWRKIYPNDVREMVTATSRDGGKTFGPPTIVGNDKWVIAGCPHRGAGLGVDGAGAVHITWYSEGAGKPAIYHAVSKDRGATYTKEEIAVTPGFFPDHPALAVAGGKVYLTWEEVTPVFGNIMFMAASGTAPRRLSDGMRRSSSPAVAVNANGAVAVAWSKDEMRNARSLLRVSR